MASQGCPAVVVVTQEITSEERESRALSLCVFASSGGKRDTDCCEVLAGSLDRRLESHAGTGGWSCRLRTPGAQQLRMAVAVVVAEASHREREREDHVCARDEGRCASGTVSLSLLLPLLLLLEMTRLSRTLATTDRCTQSQAWMPLLLTSREGLEGRRRGTRFAVHSARSRHKSSLSLSLYLFPLMRTRKREREGIRGLRAN